MENRLRFRKNIRLKNFDYSNNGAYFVTICTDQKRKIINKEFKMTIKRELLSLVDKLKGVKLDFYSIVSNHLHLIFIFRNSEIDLPHLIQAFKSLTTLKIKKSGFKGKRFWQRNYYEHVIRDEKGLNKIREYIMNNPLKEKLELKEIYKTVGAKLAP